MNNMNLVDMLLKSDVENITARETKEIEIKRLSKKFGKPFIITVGAIDGELFAELTSTAIKKGGEVDYAKSFAANALVAVEGLINPDLKDKQLQEHFSAVTPKELAQKLFKGDISKISSEIATLSGFGEDDEEEGIVKN